MFARVAAKFAIAAHRLERHREGDVGNEPLALRVARLDPNVLLEQRLFTARRREETPRTIEEATARCSSNAS